MKETQKFAFTDTRVPSKDVTCKNCGKTGFHKAVIIIPLEQEQGKPTPSIVAVLCKGCLTIEKLNYADYLELVGLEDIKK